MSGAMQIVLILAAVGYVLVRRMMGEPAQGKRMLILPGILTVIGVSDLSGQLHSSTSMLFLVGTAAISVVLGALRGASVRISQRDGVAFVRYTVVTIVLWAVNLAVKFGANFLLSGIDQHAASALGNSLLFTLGLGMLAEGLVVLYRALSKGHQVAWAKGRDGDGHQMSPMLDNLHRSMNNRVGDRADAGWNTRYGQSSDYRH